MISQVLSRFASPWSGMLNHQPRYPPSWTGRHVLFSLVLVTVLLMCSVLGDTPISGHCPDHPPNCGNTKYFTSETNRTGEIRRPPYSSPGCQLWSISQPPGYILTISFEKLVVQSDLSCISCLTIGPEPLVTWYPKDVAHPYHSKSEHELVWIRFYSNCQYRGSSFNLKFITGKLTEKKCANDMFQCSNKRCILKEWLCNGIDECGDMSDELCPTTGSAATTRPFVTNLCGPKRFQCVSKSRGEMECFQDSAKCDGIKDCQNGMDEKNCDKRPTCGRVFLQPTGFITSPNYAQKKAYPKNSYCNWTINIHYGKVQLRKVAFDLAPGQDEIDGDWAEFYDGFDENAPLIAHYDYNKQPPDVIESNSNIVFIKFHAGYDRNHLNKRGFNFTYQRKGVCLSDQKVCKGEEDCYTPSKEQCDGIWHCKRHGEDEKNCQQCKHTGAGMFPCGSRERCYPVNEHCNGNPVCFDDRDELNCTAEVCNPGNGTYLCQNHKCIYESWLCDGRDDCGDGSDEVSCTVPSVRVILAAVVGSLVCALLLVIAIGCIIRLFSARFHEHHGGSRYETPMSRIQAEFMRRQAPPPYMEAMRTSRPFTEFIAQIQSARRRSRSSTSDTNPLVPPTDENENQSGGVINAVFQTNQAAPTSAAQIEETPSASWRQSNASDITTTSSDCSLILNHSSDTLPPLMYDRELSEELSPDATSCIDISSSSGTTVQWTRLDRSASQPDLETPAAEENQPFGVSHTNDSNSENKNTESPETDDDSLIDPLGSDTDTCSSALDSVHEEQTSSPEVKSDDPRPCLTVLEDVPEILDSGSKPNSACSSNTDVSLETDVNIQIVSV